MALPLTNTKLALDTTGKSPNNRIVDEPHTLGDFRFRAIAMNLGVFFANSLVIVDAVTERVLTLGVDYKYLIPYQSLSMIYSEDLVGAAIITNPDVSKNVKVTYQALGADYVHNIPGIVDLLNTDNLTAISDSYLDTRNKDVSFTPSPHIHDLGDGIGFEYLVFAIETLGRVIMNSDGPLAASMIDRISIRLQEIAQNAQTRQDREFMILMEDFRKNFTKEKMGLGKVPNYPEATEQDGIWAGSTDFRVSTEINNRLVTLKSLVSFRQAILDRVVSKEKTNLGRLNGVYMLPTLGGLESLPNGGRVLVDSIEANMLAGLSPDLMVYPDRSQTQDKWTIVKVTNNPDNRGGILQGFNNTTGQSFVGILIRRKDGVGELKWRRHMTESDVESTYKLLLDHIQSRANPHGIKAYHVDLDQVANLPVADRRTILGRLPKMEYVTYDGLLLFFMAFISGDWTINDDPDADPEQKAKARNAYTTLFATAGICSGNAGDGLTVEIAPRPTSAPIPVRGQPAGWYCENQTKIAKFTDGLGGYYLENTPNASECGYSAEVANYEIRDQEGEVIGLAFGAGGRVDPAAVTALQDSHGTTVCFVYPSSAVGRTAAVRDGSGNILGYAVNPSFVNG